jgi:hypothetical protein
LNLKRFDFWHDSCLAFATAMAGSRDRPSQQGALMRKTLLALVATSAIALSAGTASAATLIGSYWVGGGTYWADGYPQTAYSPLDAAVLIFGPGKYNISIYSTSVTKTGWVDGYGTSVHLKYDWDNGVLGNSPVAQDFKPRPTYDSEGAFSAFIQDREGLFGSITDPNASINYVFAAVPEPSSWAMLIAGFGLVGAAARRRRAVAAA